MERSQHALLNGVDPVEQVKRKTISLLCSAACVSDVSSGWVCCGLWAVGCGCCSCRSSRLPPPPQQLHLAPTWHLPHWPPPASLVCRSITGTARLCLRPSASRSPTPPPCAPPLCVRELLVAPLPRQLFLPPTCAPSSMPSTVAQRALSGALSRSLACRALPSSLSSSSSSAWSSSSPLASSSACCRVLCASSSSARLRGAALPWCSLSRFFATASPVSSSGADAADDGSHPDFQVASQQQPQQHAHTQHTTATPLAPGPASSPPPPSSPSLPLCVCCVCGCRPW